MPILRINQQPGGAPNRYRIDVEATGVAGRARDQFSRVIDFELTAQDSERIRWYLEDYLQFDEDPAPQIAGEVEAFMAASGERLFSSIFEGSNPALLLWAALAPHLASTRIEITTGIPEAAAIPWELIRNPHTRTFLALSAESFVRTQRESQGALTPAGEAEKVRILLVICRPGGGRDVPFRSVAGRLVTRLSDAARDAFDIDVLRPPTYEQLATTLRLAKERGAPYHVVHFDGHGTYAEAGALANVGSVFNSIMLRGEGPRGFLAFEDPENEQNSKFVDGLRLGALLRDEGVPVFVLNACQSAFAEAPAKPAETGTETRDEVEAYGSLAQAVMEAGAAGVVAMRYSVYVVTAAQFVAELYGALARGRRLGEAVSWARKNLADRPERQIAYGARPLQDWPVPLVWEREPLRLWREKPDAPYIVIKLDEGAASPGALDRALPDRPDIGFFGRDETLYALDRAFDSHRIVLLHAYAGSGKTSTAAEFARWYALTGGVEGPVLFSSFERHLPLARVLDKIGEVFGPALEAGGIHWDAITDQTQRRKIALQVLRQVPVLWIWDNIEPITGFPAGTASDWSEAEQQELRAFLRAARDSKAKFLLTSRREEQAWLGDLARRVEVPEMPMQERLQLAGAIAAQRGRQLSELPDLRPLLRFTHGNPLTILVTLGEALRAGIDTQERLDVFVAALRVGEVNFADEASEGRSRSLGASLSYGFGTAFSEDERRILALLHLFQGFVAVDALRLMGRPDTEWCLDPVRGISREQSALLFDRAAEIGLLTARGNGYYSIHPALPWYFRLLFERHFDESSGDADRALRAFAGAMGELGNFYAVQFANGNSRIISVVVAEEDNLLAACRMARSRGWWRAVVSAIQGLRNLYEATGRRAAWRRLLDELVPDFVDPAPDDPLAGREELWSVVMEYPLLLAERELNWAEAERLQGVRVNWNKRRAQRALAVESDKRTPAQQNVIRTLAGSLLELGQIQIEQRHPACADTYHEALRTAGAIHDTAMQAVCAFSIGQAYQVILRDFEKAERWYRESLHLNKDDDGLGKGRCLSRLGQIAYERFDKTQKADGSNEQWASQLISAHTLCEQALSLLPHSAVTERGIVHNQLGIIYNRAGDHGLSLYHFQRSIRDRIQSGEIFAAGQTRFHTAAMLFGAARFQEARAYAEAALENFHIFGDRAAADIQDTERLIVDIDDAIAKRSGAE